jgi:hypothetical protein
LGICLVCRPLNRNIDLLFILDGSGSVAGEAFATQRRMLERMVDLIEIGPNKTRMAILQYSGWNRVEFKFDDYMVGWSRVLGCMRAQSKATLLSAVNNITHFGGSTRTGRALEKAQQLFSPDFGARTGRQDVAQAGFHSE